MPYAPWLGFGAALVTVNLLVPLGSVADALEGKDDEAPEDLSDLRQCEELARRALDILNAGGKDAYRTALATLDEATQDWWEDELESEPQGTREDGDSEPYRKTAADLKRFIESEALSWYSRRQREIENRPFIRAQAFGEAVDPDRLGRLARYEVHLDRKLERMLAMLSQAPGTAPRRQPDLNPFRKIGP